MKTTLFTLFLLVFFGSCESEKTKSIEEKIRGKDYKFWFHVKTFPEKNYSDLDSETLYFLYFDKNGKYLLFYKSNVLAELVRDGYAPDIIESDSWKIREDSILTLKEFAHFSIKKLEDDMMLLHSTRNETYSLYIAAPDSLIPVKYHCIQK